MMQKALDFGACWRLQFILQFEGRDQSHSKGNGFLIPCLIVAAGHGLAALRFRPQGPAFTPSTRCLRGIVAMESDRGIEGEG